MGRPVPLRGTCRPERHLQLLTRMYPQIYPVSTKCPPEGFSHGAGYLCRGTRPLCFLRRFRPPYGYPHRDSPRLAIARKKPLFHNQGTYILARRTIPPTSDSAGDEFLNVCGQNDIHPNALYAPHNRLPYIATHGRPQTGREKDTHCLRRMSRHGRIHATARPSTYQDQGKDRLLRER